MKPNSKVLDSLDKIFNQYYYSIPLGALVLINSDVIFTKYKLRAVYTTNHDFSVGLVLKGPVSADELVDGHYNDSPNIYYKRMYKLIIHGKILNVFVEDIKEIII